MLNSKTLKMKKVIFILFTFISLSFYSQQIEFEKTLRKENVETLNSQLQKYTNA